MSFDARAVRIEHVACQQIPRILHRDDGAGLDQHARDQVERLLRAGRDEHIVGAAIDAAAESDVAADRLAQLRQAFGVGVEPALVDRATQRMQCALAPLRFGKQPG